MTETTGPKPTVQALAHEYQRCLIALEGAVTAMADEHRPAYELAGCLMRSLMIPQTLRAIQKGEWEPGDGINQRQQIYWAFGAPGHWSYASALGQALQRLYGLRLSQDADTKEVRS